MGGFGDGRKIE
jgi:actin-like ATPase involved in cell morphogenesis